jgi:DNA-binding NtrC family response regulator
MLKLLERIIREKTPYQITVANNSLELPNLMAQNQYDLIITDLKMPGMDGLDILKHIKEREYETEVIMITAFGSLESAMEALSLGVFDYITKPFKKEQIIYTVDRAMRYQGMRKEIRRLTGIYDLEPLSTASEAFEREYIRRISQRCGGDIDLTAARSGLPPDKIRMTLDKLE